MASTKLSLADPSLLKDKCYVAGEWIGGAETIDVARIYEGVGFRRIGTTCTAEID